MSKSSAGSPTARFRPETRLVHGGTLRSEFGETNDEGRYEESFHRSAVGIGREMNPSATFSARVLKLMSKLASNQ